MVTNYCHSLPFKEDSNTRLCKTALHDHLLTHPCGSISKNCSSVLFLVWKYPLTLCDALTTLSCLLLSNLYKICYNPNPSRASSRKETSAWKSQKGILALDQYDWYTGYTDEQSVFIISFPVFPCPALPDILVLPKGSLPWCHDPWARS